MAWTLDRTSDTTVTITVTSPTGKLILNGVPHLTIAPGFPAPSSAVLSGNSIVLTYPGLIGVTFIATLLPGDPALRNSVGSYLAAQAVSITGPGTTTVEFYNGSTGASAQVGVANDIGSALIITMNAGTLAGETRWIMNPAAQGVSITILQPNGDFLATIAADAYQVFTWSGTLWA